MMSERPWGVSPKDFHDYLERLQHELIFKALDEHQIGTTSDGRVAMNRYVHDNLMDDKSRLHREIRGEKLEFNYYTIDTDRGRRTFPVINLLKFKPFVGPVLQGTYFFYKESDEMKISYVEVEKHSLIIP